MAYSNNDILAFSELFKGNTNAYGVTEVGEIVDGKAQSKSTLIYGEVTPAVINRHLSGSLSIGLSPMQEDGTCFFGAIDIDDYKYDYILLAINSEKTRIQIRNSLIEMGIDSKKIIEKSPIFINEFYA